MAKAIGIDHIAVYVSDMKAATAFFLALGLDVDAEYQDEIFFSVGDQKLAIFKGTNKQQTINHLALKVDDAVAIKKQMEKLGYKIYKHDMVDGPDGVRIQLIG